MVNKIFEKDYHPLNERGSVLIIGLLVVLLLSILGLGAMMTTATELKISGNDRSAKRAFYLSEAGLEDARSRMQVGLSLSPIYDTHPTNASWEAFIGTNEKTISKGYQSTNSNHTKYNRLDTSLDYVVTITHKLDSYGNIIYWGDSNGDGVLEENISSGKNIYVITSEGYTPDGASKPVTIEATRPPDITVPAALYTKTNTVVQGNSTYIIGTDQCGGSNLPGILSMSTVTQNGLPQIEGSPPVTENSTQNINIQYMINRFKQNVNYQYNASGQTLTGMHWGSPTLGATPQDASSCNDHNVVYFNTNSTFVKFMGGTSGCGLLLVEGDLNVGGGFNWYGVILVTGSVVFSGGGEKNVTGAMLAGGGVSADLVSGDASLIYCSEAVTKQTSYLPLLTLRWMEIFS